MSVTNENYAFVVEQFLSVANLKENVYREASRYLTGQSDSLSPKLFKDVVFEKAALSEFGQRIFSFVQLKSILFHVINFFLTIKDYNGLITVIRHCAVNSSYSNVPYKSTSEEYTLDERSFDRFMEMLNATNISTQSYIPMLLYCLDADSEEEVKIWIRPIKEYFKRKNNYDNLVDYTLKNNSVSGYSLILDVDPEFGSTKLVDLLLFSSVAPKGKYRTLLINCKRAAAKALPYLNDPNPLVRDQAVRILLMFKTDESIFYKLTQCYLSENINRIRSAIASECGLKDSGLKLASVQDFFDYCAEFEYPYKRKLPELYLDNGAPAGELVYGAFITHLSDKRKPLTYAAQARELAKFITSESLTAAADIFYEQINFSTDKFKLPFAIMFGSESTLMKELTRQATITNDEDDFNLRVFHMPALRNHFAVRRFYYDVLKDTKRKKLHKHAQSALMLISELHNIDIENMYDEKVDTFNLDERGVAKFADNSTLSLTAQLEIEVSAKGSLAAKSAPALERELRQEIKRMENAMISGRRWTRDNFVANVINNPLLNRIAATLFFAEYKRSRLVNIFIVEGCIRDLSNKPYMPEAGIDILVAHPLDIFARFENQKFNLFQPFKQADREFFRPSADDIAKNCVERFNSYLIDETILAKRLKQYGWSLAAPLESGAVTHCTKSSGGVVAIMTFREPLYPKRGTSASIGQVKFFSQSSTIKHFIPQRTRPLDIAGMDKRLFSEFLYDISGIVKG